MMIRFLIILPESAAIGYDLACVSTTFRVVGTNDKIGVSAFGDPKVPGVTCHVSQARTGRRTFPSPQINGYANIIQPVPTKRRMEMSKRFGGLTVPSLVCGEV
jgi:hypothetical protein